jgi:hypothetical protein
MDAFIKGFLGLFIAAVITYIAVGTISAELDASSARGFMDSAKKEIAESNFSGNVIQEVGRTAKENGYALEVNVYGKESGKQSAAYGENESGSIGDTQDVECAELVLTYDYSIPILGSKSTHTVRGNVN